MCFPTSAFFSVGEQGCDETESIPVGQNFHVACRQVAISNVLGLHLRAADKFVRLCKRSSPLSRFAATASLLTAGAS